jgi:starvation-inducible outer membrane lipoprotein
MNTHLTRRVAVGVLLVAGALILSGCASITENTHAYLGAPQLAPANPSAVQIFTSEPKQPKIRLGEIILSVEGNPSRQDLENRLKVAAARLGADGVFIAADQTHIFPITYWDWWGPDYSEDWHRVIVGVAFKNQ